MSRFSGPRVHLISVITALGMCSGVCAQSVTGTESDTAKKQIEQALGAEQDDEASGGSGRTSREAGATYQPTWDSLARHETPKWFEDAVLGVYFHWGVYSVPAFGCWGGRNMYLPTSPADCRRTLVDILGREVMELRSGGNDIRHIAPGVYFVREEVEPSDGTREDAEPRIQGSEDSRVRKVVIQR